MASPASFPMRHADFDQRLPLDALPVHRGRLMRVCCKASRWTRHAAARLPTLPAAGAAQRRARPDGGAGRSGPRPIRACRQRWLAPAGRIGRRADGGKRAAAARWALRLDAGRLRGGLSLLHDRQERPDPAGHQHGDTGPGGAGAAHARGEEGGFHGHGRAGAHPERTCSKPSICSAPRAASATRTWCSRRWATRACSRRCPGSASSPRWRCRCTRPRRNCARTCCRARRESRPKRWSNSANSMPATRAIRSSINGRCSRASTTATTSSTPSCACSGQVRRAQRHSLQQPGRR